MANYDLVVIGSGPAGEKGAAQAAYFGRKVAVVESRSEVGGVSVHTGTLPSKTLRESSLYLSGVRSRGLHGVNYFVKRDISVQDFMYRRHQVVQREVERIRHNLDRHRIDHLHGRATLTDPHTVRLDDGRVLAADKVLLATGSRPHRPDFLPFDDPHVFDSDTILDISAMPRSLCIIGAGVIGCEYATIFAALGIRVVLLEPKASFLDFLDGEIRDLLKDEMQQLGVHILSGATATKVVREAPHGLKVVLQSGEDFFVDGVLYASGRQGNTQGLGLEKLGIAPTSRGHIPINEHFQTAVPNVYAAGDVIGIPGLASTSMEQGRVAMCHAFDIHYKERLAPVWPTGIYTIPEVSAVGETEASCEQKGLRYEVGRARFTQNARAQIIGDEAGLLKLLFSPDSLKLLGVHVIGEKASELVHIGQMCLALGGTIDSLLQTVFNYPTLSEAYKYAAYDGLGRLSKTVQREGLAGVTGTHGS